MSPKRKVAYSTDRPVRNAILPLSPFSYRILIYKLVTQKAQSYIYTRNEQKTKALGLGTMQKVSCFKIFPCLQGGTQKHLHSRRRNTKMYTLLWDLNNIKTQIRKDRQGPVQHICASSRLVGWGLERTERSNVLRKARVCDAEVSEPEPPLVLTPRTASSYTERKTTAK